VNSTTAADPHLEPADPESASQEFDGDAALQQRSLRKFMGMTIAVSAVVAAPSTSIFYIAPFLAVAWYSMDVRVVGRFIGFMVAMTALSFLAIKMDEYRGIHVNYPGLLIGLITYAPWVMAFALLPRAVGPVDDEPWNWFIMVVALFVIGQSLIGLAEFVVFRDGDLVSGTYGLLNVMQGKRTISQVLFTFTLMACLLFLSCYPKGFLNLSALFLGGSAVAAAQSGHQTIFLLVSIMVVVIVAYRRFSLALKSGVVVALAWGVVLAFSPDTMDVARGWWDKVVLSESSLKRHVTKAAVVNLSEPKNFLIGTGLGQFSSRASLITSGNYLTVKIPQWAVGKSSYFRLGVEPEFLLFRDYGEQSAMSQPYFSGVSIPVEFGIPMTIALFVIVAGKLRRNNLKAREGGEAGRLAVATNIFILVFILCCGIENYAEMGQAIIIPLLLLLLVDMRIRHLEALGPQEPEVE
jgi:hypothetical protein